MKRQLWIWMAASGCLLGGSNSAPAYYVGYYQNSPSFSLPLGTNLEKTPPSLSNFFSQYTGGVFSSGGYYFPRLFSTQNYKSHYSWRFTRQPGDTSAYTATLYVHLWCPNPNDQNGGLYYGFDNVWHHDQDGIWWGYNAENLILGVPFSYGNWGLSIDNLTIPADANDLYVFVMADTNGDDQYSVLADLGIVAVDFTPLRLPVTVQGSVALDGYLGDNATVGVGFQFRNLDGGDNVTRNILLNADGTFSLPGILEGRYDVAVCAAGRLAGGARQSDDHGTGHQFGNHCSDRGRYQRRQPGQLRGLLHPPEQLRAKRCRRNSFPAAGLPCRGRGPGFRGVGPSVFGSRGRQAGRR